MVGYLALVAPFAEREKGHKVKILPSRAPGNEALPSAVGPGAQDSTGAPPDVFDSAEFYRLERAGATAQYEHGWRYFTSGRTRVFVEAAREFVCQSPAKIQDFPSPSVQDIESRLKLLKSLHSQGLVDDAELSAKKREILNDL